MTFWSNLKIVKIYVNQWLRLLDPQMESRRSQEMRQDPRHNSQWPTKLTIFERLLGLFLNTFNGIRVNINYIISFTILSILILILLMVNKALPHHFQDGLACLQNLKTLQRPTLKLLREFRRIQRLLRTSPDFCANESPWLKIVAKQHTWTAILSDPSAISPFSHVTNPP